MASKKDKAGEDPSDIIAASPVPEATAEPVTEAPISTIVHGAAARDTSEPIVEPVMKLDVRVWAARKRSTAAFISWIKSRGDDDLKLPAEWTALFDLFSKTPVK